MANEDWISEPTSDFNATQDTGQASAPEFLLDDTTGLPRADFEGRLHTAAIQDAVVARITAQPMLPSFKIQWYWKGPNNWITSVTHTGWIEYDEHGRKDASPKMVFDSPGLLATYNFGYVQGGRFSAHAVVHWRNPSNGQTGSTPPNIIVWGSIRGDNPSKAAVKAKMPDLQSQVIAYMESRFRQFDNTGLPLFGPPNGFGVMQLDTPPATAHQLWDWTDNIGGGLALFAAKKSEVANHFANIYKANPDATKLTPEMMAQALYQYYNGGFYWDWDVNTKQWKKVGTISYGDQGVSIENAVKGGAPPPDWS